jgi:hypothetical protein
MMRNLTSINHLCSRRSYQVIEDLWMSGSLSLEQIERFNHAQFEALSKGEGFTLNEVDQVWFDQCHLIAARMGILREEFYHEQFSQEHINAMQRGLDFERIKSLSADEILELTHGLTHSQSWGLRKYNLSREQVNHKWFDRSCLKDMDAGMTYEEVRIKAQNKIYRKLSKANMVANYKIDHKQAHTWLSLDASTNYWLLLVVQRNDKKIPNNVLSLIISFIVSIPFSKTNDLVEKLLPNMHKPFNSSNEIYKNNLISLRQFGIFAEIGTDRMEEIKEDKIDSTSVCKI